MPGFSLGHLHHKDWRSERDLNPCSGICSPEPRLSAIRPSFYSRENFYATFRADDGGRTRDLNLGKVPRYQLRYVRVMRVKSIALCQPWHNCNSFIPITSRPSREVAFKHEVKRCNLLDGWTACY